MHDARTQATAFAVEMGFPLENLTTPDSTKIWADWEAKSCQPNFRQNVSPDPTTSCGPYTPLPVSGKEGLALTAAPAPTRPQLRSEASARWQASGIATTAANPVTLPSSHDTISMVAIDRDGLIAAGVSTNGLTHKVGGRVGDAPIPGAGAYAEQGVGGCGGTGDGDIHLRFLPCYQVVQSMKHGVSPLAAVEDAMRRMLKFYPVFQGALFALSASGEHAGACTGWVFQYSVRSINTTKVEVYTVQPLVA